MPSFPDVDHCHIPPLVAQKLFRGALFSGRQALLRVVEERDAQAEVAEFARLVEQDSRNTEEAHCQAEKAEYACALEEDRRKAEESHRKALEQEERRRAEQEEEEERTSES